MNIHRGEFVSIIGRYGSGKSSLLHAILGEMKEMGGSKITINGKIAYVAQKPFIISATVKENILFGAPFNPEKYAAVLHFACLKADL
jgi:ABC-type transport system involved in cytochrome bd biosynthesis fused ATPase/permease subunit